MVVCECGCGYDTDSIEHTQFHYYDIMREIEQQQAEELEIQKISDMEGHTKTHVHSSECFCAEVW